MLPDLFDFVWKDLNSKIDTLREQVNTNTIRASQSQTTLGLVSKRFAALPVTNNTAGDLYFVSDGRKIGQGPGAGTGICAYWNGITSQWLRISDDSVVAN